MHAKQRTLHVTQPQAPLFPGATEPDLNLAGVDGVPDPEWVSQLDARDVPPAQLDLHPPDSTLPSAAMPDLQPFDLTGTGIDVLPAFEPVGAAQFFIPQGLGAIDAWVDTQMQQMPQLPAGPGLVLVGTDTSLLSTWPDEAPVLAPERQMPARPGELSDTALLSLEDYDQLVAQVYPAAWMDQRGNNARRARDLSLLDTGFELDV